MSDVFDRAAGQPSTHVPSLGAMAATELYLIRHGLAGEPTASRDDGLRPLTRTGRKRTGAVAKRLGALGLHLDLLSSSPLVRAWETAEILQRSGLCQRLVESTFLAPGGDFQDWLRWLARWRRRSGNHRLGVVGHMPGLGAWAETLVWGTAKQRLVLKKAGLVGLSLPPRGSPVGRCPLFLLLPPRYLV